LKELKKPTSIAGEKVIEIIDYLTEENQIP